MVIARRAERKGKAQKRVVKGRFQQGGRNSRLRRVSGILPEKNEHGSFFRVKAQQMGGKGTVRRGKKEGMERADMLKDRRESVRAIPLGKRKKAARQRIGRGSIK